MAESENISIGEYTKAGLVKELQECNIINTRLETEYKKRGIEGQNRKLKCDHKIEELENIVEKDKSVLKEVSVQYQQLHELKGCDKKLCSKDNSPGSKTAQSQSDCDCKQVEEVKNALVKLLKDNYDLCGILKETIKVFSVTAKYYPDQTINSNGKEQVTPGIIHELVKDICEELDQILKNCQLLWNDVDRSSSQLRDSGICTSHSFESLAIHSNASSDENWIEGGKVPRRRSASEHTDDQDQTEEKVFE